MQATRQDPLPGFPPYKPRLRSLPLRERPTYRIEHVGAAAVATYELLAAVIGGENQLWVAHDLLERYGSLTRLAQATSQEITQVPGIGPSRAAAIKAALELGRRLMLERPETRPQVKSPADAAFILEAQMGQPEQEELWVLLLDTRNRVLGTERVYRGTLNQTNVRVAEVFRGAVRRNCAAVIVAHNHPSGDPTPSPDDIILTRDLVQAGRLLGVEVLDHLVIGHHRWVSLKERGLGFD